MPHFGLCDMTWINLKRDIRAGQKRRFSLMLESAYSGLPRALQNLRGNREAA